MNKATYLTSCSHSSMSDMNHINRRNNNAICFQRPKSVEYLCKETVPHLMLVCYLYQPQEDARIFHYALSEVHQQLVCRLLHILDLESWPVDCVEYTTSDKKKKKGKEKWDPKQNYVKIYRLNKSWRWGEILCYYPHQDIPWTEVCIHNVIHQNYSAIPMTKKLNSVCFWNLFYFFLSFLTIKKVVLFSIFNDF